MLPLIMAACAAAGAVAGVLTTKAASEQDLQAVKRSEKVNTELINSRDKLQKQYANLSNKSTRQNEDLNRKLAQSEIEKDALYIAVRSQNELIYLMEIIGEKPSLEILVEFKKAVILTNHLLQQLGENLVPISQDYFSRILESVNREDNYSREQLSDFIAILINPEQDILTSLLSEITNDVAFQPEIAVEKQDITFNSDDIQNFSEYINEMLNVGKYEKALVYINRGITVDRNNDEFWYYKSLAFNCLNKDKYKILDLIDEAIRLNPHQGVYFYQQSLCLSNVGLGNDALKSINKAIYLEPEIALYLYEKSNLLCLFGEYSEALNLVDRAIQLEPKEFLFLEHKKSLEQYI